MAHSVTGVPGSEASEMNTFPEEFGPFDVEPKSHVVYSSSSTR
jgi:hypothetical protein